MDTFWTWDELDIHFITPAALETAYILGNINNGSAQAVVTSVNNTPIIVVGDSRECCIETATKELPDAEYHKRVDVENMPATPVQWGALTHLFRVIYYKGQPRLIRGGADYAVSTLRTWPGGPLVPSPIETIGYMSYDEKLYVDSNKTMYLCADVRDLLCCVTVMGESINQHKTGFVSKTLGDVLIDALEAGVESMFYRGSLHDILELARDMRSFAMREITDGSDDPEETLINKIKKGF